MSEVKRWRAGLTMIDGEVVADMVKTDTAGYVLAEDFDKEHAENQRLRELLRACVDNYPYDVDECAKERKRCKTCGPIRKARAALEDTRE